MNTQMTTGIVSADDSIITSWDSLDVADEPEGAPTIQPSSIPFVQPQRSGHLAAGQSSGQKIHFESDQPPEQIELYLPSYFNTSNEYSKDELTLRRKKAHHYLNQIRDLIAEKSFRYTDQIRNGPRKGVKTRARTVINELNQRISHLCQMYTWTRGRMIALGATEDDALAIYKPLSKADVRCSTAILQPNQQGSTKLTLSWIWQSISRRILTGMESASKANDEATVIECKHMFCSH